VLHELCNLKLLDVDPQDMGEEDGSVVDLDAQRKGKCAVIKTSTRQVNIETN
jgi:26S proteasome regulatory subunit T5